MADAQASSSTATLCAQSCERNVPDREARARVCGRCLYGHDDRAGWVAAFAEEVPSPDAGLQRALADPDWQVSFAAARQLAKRKGTTFEAVLASWLVGTSSGGEERAHACVQVGRAGAAQGLTFTEWRKRIAKGGRDGSKAFTALARCEMAVQSTLELELYGIDPRTAQEALSHLVELSGKSRAEVVVDAMRTRPKDTDRIAAHVLRAAAKSGGPTLGEQLLKIADHGNEERVNRLVAIYSGEVETLSKQLDARDPLERIGVVNELMPYGALATHHFERLLSDEDLRIQLLAANALARAEGRDFEGAVRARVRPTAPGKPAPAEQQARWLRLYAVSGRKTCATGVVAEVASDDRAEPVARAAAIETLGACAGERARPAVVKALGDSKVEVRVGAARALEAMPRSKETLRLSAQALRDPSPEVQAAAIAAVAAHRQHALADEIASRLTSADARVRAAAARALGVLAANAHATELARLLREDPDRDVRLAAADALGALGGPAAASALSHAAANDPESRVRHVADQWVRKLGFGSR